MSRRPRLTVVDVPPHAGVPGAHSGRQRKHGRNPASPAAAALGKNRTFSLFGEFAGQTGYKPDDLDGWRGRVLIMDADDDPHMPAATRLALRALYPQAEVHSFSGTGHSAAIVDPDGYAQVIRRFLTPRAPDGDGQIR